MVQNINVRGGVNSVDELMNSISYFAGRMNVLQLPPVRKIRTGMNRFTDQFNIEDIKNVEYININDSSKYYY